MLEEEIKNQIEKQISITEAGHPNCPIGEAGELMLKRMNDSHEAVTNWGISFLPEFTNIQNQADIKEFHCNCLGNEPESIAKSNKIRNIKIGNDVTNANNLDELKLAKLLNNKSRGLDIGCGGGATLGRLLKRYPEAIIHGIDYSSVSVGLSQKINQKEINEGKIIVTEGSVECLPYKNEYFDFITTVESFYFWPDPTNNLKEVRRVLKTNGTFCLIADIHNNGKLTEEEKANVLKYNLNNPTVNRFREIFKSAGFLNIEIHIKENTNWICVEARK